MDFEDTPEEAQFRVETSKWLEENASGYAARIDAGKESDLDLAREWQTKKAEAGFAAITWPKKYLGLEGTPIQSVIYKQEESKWRLPNGPFAIGIQNCIPTLVAFGTEEQITRYVPPALKGQEVWCQLFSEPAAGSDLGGIRTRAVKEGDEWVINGQKIWTSNAQYASYGCLIARSDPDKPKHKGMTYFFLDMKSPGVEVRPIKQISGGEGFNEVFFNDVRIPDAQRLGEVNEGWKTSMTTLMNERFGVDPTSMGGLGPEGLLRLAREVELENGQPALESDFVRQRIAHWYVRREGLKFSHYRALTALSRGQTPGPEGSINKLVMGPEAQDMARFGMDLQEMAGAALDPEVAALGGIYGGAYLGSPGLRIAGGTDDILRNTIAERVLGLPGDVRVDKDVAFKDIPTGR